MKKIITILLALTLFGFLLGCVAEDEANDTIIPDTDLPDTDLPDLDESDDVDDEFEIDIDSEIEETVIDEDDDINVGEMF